MAVIISVSPDMTEMIVLIVLSSSSEEESSISGASLGLGWVSGAGAGISSWSICDKQSCISRFETNWPLSASPDCLNSSSSSLRIFSLWGFQFGVDGKDESQQGGLTDKPQISCANSMPSERQQAVWHLPMPFQTS